MGWFCHVFLPGRQREKELVDKFALCAAGTSKCNQFLENQRQSFATQRLCLWTVQEFKECMEVIEEQLRDSNGMLGTHAILSQRLCQDAVLMRLRCEYAIYVKALIKRQEGQASLLVWDFFPSMLHHRVQSAAGSRVIAALPSSNLH